MRQLAIILCSLVIIGGGCRQESSESQGGTSTTTLPVEPTVAPAAARPTTRALTLLPSPSATTPPDISPTPVLDAEASSVPATATATLTLTPSPTAVLTGDVEGALIQVTMPGRVGVLLDEFPEEMRGRVAAALLQDPPEVWRDRARRQVRLTRLRLNFRDGNSPGKGQLPLPQPELWSIALDDNGPAWERLQGHNLIMLDYTFTTTILTDAASTAEAEPALATVGGTWEEYFMFPADPDLLLQRTGQGCINDDGFPPDSFDSENAWYFYDYDRIRCREVVAARVGVVESNLRFERLAWDDDLADRVRTGAITNLDAPDLRVVGSDLDNHRIIYRYVQPGDCALEEGAVNGSGWRRLLQFDATVHNVGNGPLHVGNVRADSGVDDMFVYAPCHDHVHYTYFGDFSLRMGDQVTSSKQAFCVQSTDRRSNNELSPLTHDYSCSFQGVQTGWVDEYIAGLDTQWMDITDLEIAPEGEALELGFTFNPGQFLCEGRPVVDENGERLWEPSNLITAEGVALQRPQCDFVEEWDVNNDASRAFFVRPTGSFVTAACPNGEAGPLRNCGFSALKVEGVDAVCRPGQQVWLSVRTLEPEQPQVVRICERSAALGTGVACTVTDSLANVIVDEQSANITFSCPAVRDQNAAPDAEAGPNYALYSAPVWPGDETLPVVTAE